MYLETRLFEVLDESGYQSKPGAGMNFMGPAWTEKNFQMLQLAIRNSAALVKKKDFELQYCYYFGLAQAYILDRLSGQEWKNHYFEDGVWFETLIERFVEEE